MCTVSLVQCNTSSVQFVLYSVGDIKSAAHVTYLAKTQVIIVARGSCAYTYNDLPLPVHDRQARHLAVAHCFAGNVVQN